MVIFVDLDDLHTANRRVVEVERLRVVGIDHHSLRAGILVDGVTGDRFHLRRYYGAGDAGNGDFTRLIRPGTGRWRTACRPRHLHTSHLHR